MKTLDELTAADDPAIRLVREWVAAARVPCEILPPAATRAETLVAMQVSTQSVLGAVAFETGGLLVDHGWLRILGSGHPKLSRSLPQWNEGRADGFYLVADDALGGFFALNGGRWGPDRRKLYYFAPDSLRWEALGVEYSQFVMWSMSGDMDKFYESERWAAWRGDVPRLHGDRCYFFSPPLWTEEGSPEKSRRGEVPVAESWGLQMDFATQLERAADGAEQGAG